VCGLLTDRVEKFKLEDDEIFKVRRPVSYEWLNRQAWHNPLYRNKMLSRILLSLGSLALVVSAADVYLVS
jgi:hypothetical protein